MANPVAHQCLKSLAACSHRVRELTGDIARRVEAGEVLYVHCWGGRGRAGTVGACLLASLYGVDAEQALARVQRAYNTRGELGACLYSA